METDEIVKKSISGAKWAIILSIIALPIGYLLNIILGRVSPEALGIYGFVQIFIAAVTTFVLFGGSNVIIKYLPEIDKDKRVSFLLTYLVIVFSIFMFAIGLGCMYPQILDLVFAQKLPLGMLNYFIVLAPIIVLFSVFNYTLSGLMEIKVTVLLGKITTFWGFAVFGIFFFFKDFFRENLWMIIWSVFFVSYTIGGIIAIFTTINKIKCIERKSQNNRCNESVIANTEKIDSRQPPGNSRVTLRLNYFKPYLPGKFWSFALFVHLSTITYFASDKIDQLFILNFFNIRELGLYYAALRTVMFIRFIPMLLGGVSLATFSNLVASNEIEMIKKSHREIVRFNTLIVVPVSLMCIFFSKQILGVFGEAYIQNDFVLVVLAAFYSTTSIGVANNSLIIAKGKAGAYFLAQIATPIVGFSLMYLLIGKLGVLGLAIGRGSMLALWQVISIVLVSTLLRMGIKIPKSYKIGLIISVVAFLIYIAIPAQNILIHVLCFLSCFFAFIYFADYSKKDLDFIVRQLFYR